MSSPAPPAAAFDADVVVIGSGFGGAVAALRFAEMGARVVVLERGAWIRRDQDAFAHGFFWRPERNRFGMNDVRRRGATILPWLGAAVGGGSHVDAGTLKRCDDWDGFPSAIASDDMGRWYDVADAIMASTPYPSHPPDGDNRATQLLFAVGHQLRTGAPELVADHGAVRLAISFAPPGGEPGAPFVARSRATRRRASPPPSAR